MLLSVTMYFFDPWDWSETGETMRSILCLLAVCLIAPFFATGCLGSFAENQARRQAARSADYYVRNYAEPALEQQAAGDPYFQQDMRQARNDIADTIVRTGNPRQETPVGVDDRGWLTDGHYR